MSVVRLGVIGAGQHSTRRVYPAILRLTDAALVAVCDLDRQRATAVARRFGAREIYADHREMFARAEVDAVVVCIGPEEHASLAIEAMRAGFPVYTEKPPAISAVQARAVWTTSQETGHICMTGFRKRFAPAYARARDIINSSTFGAPGLLSVWRSSGPFENLRGRPTTWFLLDMGIHAIDLIRFLCGEVREVMAWARDLDSYVVQLRFTNGALGSMALTSRQSWRLCSERVEITGANGQFVRVADSIRMCYYGDNRIHDLYEPNFSIATGDSLYEAGFVPELTEFVAAIRESRQSQSSIENAYRSMLLYEAIWDSAAADGQKICLPKAGGQTR